MKVLLVNTSELRGGAAIAVHRLMGALNQKGVTATMLVGKKETNCEQVVALKPQALHRINFLLERLKIWMANGLSRKNLFAVDIASHGTDITRLEEFKSADVIHLHWVNQGMISLEGLRKILASGKPLVWTMHDMWPFTGICHLTYDCECYKTACQNCPQLCRPAAKDLSCKVFDRKLELMENGNVHFVAVSRKLAEKARESRLLRGQELSVIPNVFPVETFNFCDKRASREALGLPVDKIILAFGASRIDDPCKGLDELKKALKILIQRGNFKAEELHLALFGGIKHPEALSDLPTAYTHLGYVSNEKDLSQVYSAADAAVIPSLYETFGQVVVEAQACGCLPVTFTGSGQMDIITHRENGYLAEYLSAEDFAAGIEWAITTKADPAALKAGVKAKFDEGVVAQQYIDLYERLLATKHNKQ